MSTQEVNIDAHKDNQVLEDGVSEILGQLSNKQVAEPKAKEEVPNEKITQDHDLNQEEREKLKKQEREKGTDAFKSMKDFNKKIRGEQKEEPKAENPEEKPKAEEKAEVKTEEKVEEKKTERQRKFAGLEKKETEERKEFDLNSLPDEIKAELEFAKKIKEDRNFKIAKKFEGKDLFKEVGALYTADPSNLSDKKVYELMLKDELGYTDEQITDSLDNFENLSLADKMAIKNHKEKLSLAHKAQMEETLSDVLKPDLESIKERQAFEKRQQEIAAEFTNNVDETLATIKGTDFLGMNIDDKELSDFKEYLKNPAVPVRVDAKGNPDVKGFIEDNFKVKNFENIVSIAIEYGIAEGLTRKKDEKSHSGAALGVTSAPASSTKRAKAGDKDFHKQNLPQIKYMTSAVSGS